MRNILTDKSKQFIQQIPTGHSNLFKIYLFNGGTNILLGYLDTSGKGTYIKHINLSKNKHKKFKSIGFYYNLLTDSTFHWIRVITTKNQILETSRLYSLHFGSIINCDANDYSKQILLPYVKFGYRQAIDWEKKNIINKQKTMSLPYEIFNTN